MELATFDNYAREILSIAEVVRNNKMVEYEASIDRLANFRKAAELQSKSVPEAISGMMSKHTVSIYDMINAEFKSRNVTYDMQLWIEKIGDQLNYLLLLYAAIKEDRCISSSTESRNGG